MKFLSGVFQYGIFLFSFLFITSCIDEDLSGCLSGPPQTVEIHYTYYTPSGPEEAGGIDPKEVEDIHLFVFDEYGRFIKDTINSTPGFSDQFYQTLTLDPGEYSFVAWANVRDCYRFSHNFIPGQTTLYEVLLHFEAGNDNIVTTSPHPLFHGNIVETVRNSGEIQKHTIEIVKNTYNITVQVSGLPSVERDYTLSIKDIGNKYNFVNSYASTDEVTYITSCINNTDYQPSGSLTVQRLMENRRNATLQLINETQQETIYDENLIELILLLRSQGKTVDFTKIYDYLIELSFNEEGQITVIINGWKVIEDDYELDKKDPALKSKK